MSYITNIMPSHNFTLYLKTDIGKSKEVFKIKMHIKVKTSRALVDRESHTNIQAKG